MFCLFVCFVVYVVGGAYVVFVLARVYYLKLKYVFTILFYRRSFYLTKIFLSKFFILHVLSY